MFYIASFIHACTAGHTAAFTLVCECVSTHWHIYSPPTPVSFLKTFTLFTPDQKCPLDIFVQIPLKRVQTIGGNTLSNIKYAVQTRGPSMQMENTHLVIKAVLRGI